MDPTEARFQGMMKNIRTIFWFLKRPRLYPELIRLLSGKVFCEGSLRYENPQEATVWCKKLEISTERAFRLLIGNKAPTPVGLLFPGYFENAERIQYECPFQMGGAGELDILYWSAEHLQATRVIETGVAYGWSSLAILLSLHNRKESQLISTDMPYPNMDNDSYVGCVVPKDLSRNWQIIRYADRQALPKAIKILSEIDMCHYDSDKSYKGRMWAYPVLWKALRKGGIFISDDIGDNMSFCEFSKMVGCSPMVIHKDNKYIGILIKSWNG